jgi:Zn-dependent M28 family amino/carboxypeptidase
MRTASLLIATALALATSGAVAANSQNDPAAPLWRMVARLADDGLEGRMTGTPGYDRAAALVVQELQRIGLQPAGADGFRQWVDLVRQDFDPALSAAMLTGGAEPVSLAMPGDLYFRGSHAMPASVDAPLVFAGYGLSIPEAGHDDFAGLDVRGKVVLVLSGGPQSIAGSIKASTRSERAALLARRGAVGMIALTTPRQVEIPWDRQVALAARPSMYLADAQLREVQSPFMTATFSPTASDKLFAGSGRSFAELAALADASQPLPRFDLPLRFAARIGARITPVRSANIVARLPGRDRVLAREHVVLSAHLDGLGINEPIGGDAIYNGALDNAYGVASVIAIARDLKRGKRPKRSILFFLPTAEEVGLLGSSYFAKRPTVPLGSIVANVNFDMPLPIFPLRTITPIGYEESTLGDDAAAVSSALGLPIVPDPFPDRNVFIRSDQYSFVRAGVPALFPKFGFARDTPEAALERAWRANIYHSPRDDMRQPILRAEALRFNAWNLALLRRIADNPERPRWRDTSLFARYAR